MVSTDMARLRRIPQRVWRDVRLMKMLSNWREALSAELSGGSLKRFELRNGIVLSAPEALDLNFLFQEIWLRGIYSPPGFEIRRGDVVIDVGANIGVFAAFAASRAPEVKVYAYEPFPGNIEWLQRNMKESGLTNVNIRAQAMAGAQGERVLHVNPESWIVHSLVREDGGDGKQDISVKCLSLDEALDAEGIARCDLLKLDCEGSEYEILQGCSPAALKRVRRIVGEYHDRENLGTGESLCRFLESRAFRIDRFEPLDAGCGVLCATNTAV
jgi:FkbM family methyltransferase